MQNFFFFQKWKFFSFFKFFLIDFQNYKEVKKKLKKIFYNPFKMNFHNFKK